MEKWRNILRLVNTIDEAWKKLVEELQSLEFETRGDDTTLDRWERLIDRCGECDLALATGSPSLGGKLAKQPHSSSRKIGEG